MKNIIFSVLGLLLIGAGCLGGKSVEGDWWLAFDLPTDWAMASAYDLTSESPDSFSLDVNREMDDIVLQSTVNAIQKVDGEYTPNDFAHIRVLRLDDRRIIPSEAEDLGNGFFKESDENYYLETETGKYQFKIIMQGSAGQSVEEVILSAQAVTIE